MASCIKDKHEDLKNNCKIIYWQALANVVGVDLKAFLAEKYGIHFKK